MESTFEDIKKLIVNTGEKVSDHIYKKRLEHDKSEMYWGHFEIGNKISDSDNIGEPIFICSEDITLIYDTVKNEIRSDCEAYSFDTYDVMQFDDQSHYINKQYYEIDEPIYEYKFFNTLQDIEDFKVYYKEHWKNEYNKRLEKMKRNIIKRINEADEEIRQLNDKKAKLSEIYDNVNNKIKNI